MNRSGRVDSHVHIFPNMGGPSGFESVERHMQFATQITFHRSEGRRLHDNAPVVGRDWHKGEDLNHVNLRGGDYGRFLWTADGVDYARYYLPPTARDLDSPPEQIIAQMDYIGVDRGVVQAGHVYGRLNDYLARVAAKYPDRLWALATVEEWRADDPSQIAEIERAVRELGLRGLFFDTGLIGKFGRTTLPGDPIFDPFWETVRRLDIPVFWNITSPEPTVDKWLKHQRSFGRWLTRYPDVKCVYTHGLPLYRFFDDSGGINIPDEAWAPLDADNVYTEILVPILMGGAWEYPYVESQPFIRAYYERIGPDRLVWGSDLPNVERHCTYEQSLRYLERHCDFIPLAHMKRITGENTRSLFEG